MSTRVGTHILLDAQNTHVSFSAMLGVAQVRGHFRDVRGEVVIDGDDLARTALSIDVAAASVATGIRLRDRHLCGTTFLDAAHHPLVSFRSDRVTRDDDGGGVLVSGLLTLRGVERRIVTRAPLAAGDGQGLGGTVALQGEIVVDREAHHIGAARGLERLNPIFLFLRRDVRVRVDLLLAARYLLPALLPALGR